MKNLTYIAAICALVAVGYAAPVNTGDGLSHVPQISTTYTEKAVDVVPAIKEVPDTKAIPVTLERRAGGTIVVPSPGRTLSKLVGNVFVTCLVNAHGAIQWFATNMIGAAIKLTMGNAADGDVIVVTVPGSTQSMPITQEFISSVGDTIRLATSGS